MPGWQTVWTEIGGEGTDLVQESQSTKGFRHRFTWRHVPVALMYAIAPMQGVIPGFVLQPGGGGGPGPCMRHPPAPPPPQVLKDSDVGAMAPTALKFFCACFPFIKPSMF